MKKRRMDFTTENLDCCEIGDTLTVTEQKLPTSYWYLLEHSWGASGNFKTRERLHTVNGITTGIVVDKRRDDRFKYLILEFDEPEVDAA